MKKQNVALYLLAFAAGLLFMMTGCSKENQGSLQDPGISAELKAGNSGPSANGHGFFTFDDYKRQFTFHANTKPDGSVKGNGVLIFTADGGKIEFDIDCLSLADNMATMSGMVTASTNPNLVGWKCWFKVLDNGEGDGSDPDQISYLVVSEELDDCMVDLEAPLSDLYDIDGGNIQVKP